MELFEVYDINRQKTAKIIDRNGNEKLQEGEYHIVVEAVIINSKGKILITKRAETKTKYPLLWECNGGSVIYKETSREAVLREVREELGIIFKNDEAIYFKTVRDDKSKYFKDIWIFKKNIKLSELNFSDKEVIDAKWVTIDEFEKLKQKGEIVPTNYLSQDDFKKCFEILKI